MIAGNWQNIKLSIYIGPHMFIRYTILFRVGLCAVLVAILCTASAQETNNLNAFKQLLSSEPCVSEITFGELLAQNTKIVTYFTGASDGTYFFIRSHLPDENIHTPLSPTHFGGSSFFVGQNGSNTWEIAGLNIFKSPLSTNVPPLIEGAQSKLNSILTFGIGGVRPGSFIWNGNHFSAQRNNAHLSKIEDVVIINGVRHVTQGDTHILTGNLILSNGVPCRIDTEGTSIFYEFTDDKSLPVGVPATITIGSRGYPSSQYSEVISILRYIQDDGSSKDIFDPEKYVVPKYTSVYIQTNLSGNVKVQSDNSLNVAKARVEQIRANGNLKRQTIIASLIFVLMSPLLWLAIKYFRKK
jgi:hypothetical protein